LLEILAAGQEPVDQIERHAHRAASLQNLIANTLGGVAIITFLFQRTRAKHSNWLIWGKLSMNNTNQHKLEIRATLPSFSSFVSIRVIRG
jgi:hypothetical protein